MNFFNSEVFRYLNKGQSKILMYVKDSEHTKRLRDIQGNFAEAPLRSPMLGRCGVRDCWCFSEKALFIIHIKHQTLGQNFPPKFSTHPQQNTTPNTEHFILKIFHNIILWFPPSNWRMKWSFRSLQNTATIWKNNICKI